MEPLLSLFKNIINSYLEHLYWSKHLLAQYSAEYTYEQSSKVIFCSLSLLYWKFEPSEDGTIKSKHSEAEFIKSY